MAGGSPSMPLLANWDEEREKAGVLAWCSRRGVVETIDLYLQTIVVGTVMAATYLLAWGKDGSVCAPANNGPLPTWVQAILASIPFTIIVPSLYSSGALKDAQNACRPLSYITTVTLIQVSLSIILWAWTSFCVIGASHRSTVAVTLCLLLAVAVTWVSSFDRTARLNTFVRSKWLGRSEDQGQV